METREVKKKDSTPERKDLSYKILVTTLATSAIPLLFFLVAILILQFSTNIWQDSTWIWPIIYGLIAICIVSTIGYYFTARRIVAPLNKLMDSIDIIRKGNLDHHIDINTDDEFGEFAEKFNQLTTNLKGEIASLRETEERYSDLIDNVSAMIHQIDKDMRFINVNRAELKLLGYSQEEMLKMRLTDLVPEEEKEKIVAHVERLKKEGKSKVDTVFIKKSGENIAVEIDANAIYKENGNESGHEFLYTSAQVSYIDKRRRLEKKLIDYATELTGKESRQADYPSVDIGRIAPIDKLAAGVAHAINKHLGVISGFIQMMLKECDRGCPSYEELGIIEKHINYTKEIIDDLLDFAMISRLYKEEVDINKNIEDALSLLEHQLLLGDISVVRNFASDLPRLFCDPGKLQHVYLSLLATSASAMKEGGALIISTSHGKDRRFIEIRIKNTGAGIPKEEIGKIYDPFYSLKGTGTGMSLSLPASYGIIKEHKGELLVESKDGTMFTICLPVDREGLAVSSEESLKRGKN